MSEDIVVDTGLPEGADKIKGKAYNHARRHRRYIREAHGLGFDRYVWKCPQCGFHVCRCEYRRKKAQQRTEEEKEDERLREAISQECVQAKIKDLQGVKC